MLGEGCQFRRHGNAGGQAPANEFHDRSQNRNSLLRFSMHLKPQFRADSRAVIK
jgi:hypothetical protein